MVLRREKQTLFCLFAAVCCPRQCSLLLRLNGKADRLSLIVPWMSMCICSCPSLRRQGLRGQGGHKPQLKILGSHLTGQGLPPSLKRPAIRTLVLSVRLQPSSRSWDYAVERFGLLCLGLLQARMASHSKKTALYTARTCKPDYELRIAHAFLQT